MLFPIAQLIEIGLAGITFASRMVVFFDGIAGEVPASRLIEPMITLAQSKEKESDWRIPAMEVKSSVLLISGGREQASNLSEWTTP